jgi:hypothetical protein
MAGGERKDLGLDGLFKLLTWRSLAISRVFGLPDIVGEPLQQEFQFPRERRVDRLYRLADGSLLNIEHQSSLADREALARRMVTYHVMIKDQFPAAGLMQIVIYTGKTPIRPEGPLVYESLDATGHTDFDLPRRCATFARCRSMNFVSPVVLTTSYSD